MSRWKLDASIYGSTLFMGVERMGRAVLVGRSMIASLSEKSVDPGLHRVSENKVEVVKNGQCYLTSNT